ncbi:DUF4227 family protein [Aureibacillus halotolerans]|uniref:Uncharacterized protein DUF4227 n=1 Tax=Aureibacillus halotolerans TaxID=1508390 RepID=A0A4R6U9T9_9BACI|nr:DUF4227 family protein [Aureibacillus halotolerans]TDQ41609.1 uncharacterized protein DUF4227 [Aureibacillus halotolerans]
MGWFAKAWVSFRVFIAFMLFTSLFYFAMTWIQNEYGYFQHEDVPSQNTEIEKVHMAPQEQSFIST